MTAWARILPHVIPPRASEAASDPSRKANGASAGEPVVPPGERSEVGRLLPSWEGLGVGRSMSREPILSGFRSEPALVIFA